jgi:hypothetical protein
MSNYSESDEDYEEKEAGKCDNPNCSHKSNAKMYQCNDCEHHFHRDCSQSHNALKKYLEDPKWTCWSCKTCSICSKKLNDEHHKFSQFCKQCDQVV